MMNDILVTVLMPVYNAMPYLPAAIDSILNQSEKKIIFLIIDDGSTDGSIEYLEKISNSLIKVYYRSHEGIIKTLNFGLEKVETKYVAIMDADDVSDPERIRSQVQFLERNTSYCAVGTSVKYIGENENGRSWRVLMPENDKTIKIGLLKRRFVLVHSSIMMRTKSVKNVHAYNEDSFPNPDFDLFLRLVHEGMLYNLSSVYHKIRFHKESHTSNNISAVAKQLFFSRGDRNDNNSLSENLISFKRKLNFFEELNLSSNTLSLYLYRNGVINFVNDSMFLGLLQILIAGLIRPDKGFYFITKKLFQKDFQRD